VVTDEKNSVASHEEALLDTQDFSASRSADYQVTLPSAQLTPWEYLLELQAQSGDHCVQRTARITVR